MRVAMIIDEQRLAQEQRLLNRLGVGLLAEGVQLVRIVPEGLRQQTLDEGERRIALASRIEAPMKALPWMRSVRVNRIIEAMEDALPDVVHVIGGGAWALGRDLAAAIERPAVIDLASLREVQAAPKPGDRTFIAGYLAASAGLAQAAVSRFGESMVALAPMGVATSHRPRQILIDPSRPAALAILGGSRDVHAYAACFAGLSRVVKQHPAIEIIIELRGPHEHEIWRHAERLGLLGAISAIGSAAQHRPLVTRCDVLLWPEHDGVVRSILLEAMAMAIPIIGSRDEALDMLRTGQTARLVDGDQADQWSAHLQNLLTEPGEARALGQRGRDHVLANHRSSQQIERTLEVLERIAGKTYAFPQRQPAAAGPAGS